MGNKVVILSSKHISKQEIGPEHEEIDGIEVVRIPSFFVDRMSWVYTPSASSMIAKVVKDYDIEIINAMHLVHYSTFTSVNARIADNIPIVISVLGTRENMGSAFLNFITRIFEHTLAKKTLGKANGIIADCIETRKSITRIGNYEQKVRVIYEGVDTSKFFPISRHERDTFNITFLGGLRKQKGVHDLMAAAPTIISRIPHAKIIFVGDGPERQNLKYTSSSLGINNNIIFMGNQPRNRVSSILQESDCFVLPSWSEGISMAILEAAATGLPIVATKAGGTTELIKNGENGLLADQRSPESIAQLIIWLSQNPEKAKQIGLAARKMAENLDWMKIATQTLDYYHSVLSEL